MSLASRISDLATRIGTEFKNTVPRTLATFTYPGPLAVTAGTARFPIVGGTYTIVGVTATVGTAPTGASILVDVNKNGTTIFSTQGNRPTIAISTNSDDSGAPNTTSVTTGDYLTVDVDQIGSTVAGANLVVTIILKRTGS